MKSLGEKYMGEQYVQEEFLGEKSVQEEFLGEESLGEEYMDEKSRKPAAGLGEVIFANKVSLGGLGAERPERIKNHEIWW